MTRVSTPDVWYGIYGKLDYETEKAYFWLITRTGKKFWMPKSQTRNLCTIPDENGDIYIEVKEWILNDKAVPDNDRYTIQNHEEEKANQRARSIQKPDDFFDQFEDDVPF